MRHRRCYQLRSRAVFNIKAYAFSVEAKIKCSYTKPTCARCAKRGPSCGYLIHRDGAADGNITGANITDSLVSNEIVPATGISPEDVYSGGEVEM